MARHDRDRHGLRHDLQPGELGHQRRPERDARTGDGQGRPARRRIIRWLKDECSFVGIELGTVHVHSSSQRHSACSNPKCRDGEGIIYRSAEPLCDTCGGAAILLPEFAHDPLAPQ